MFNWKELFKLIPDTVKKNPENTSFSDIMAIIVKVIDLLLFFGGLLALAMILYGGFLYLTSYGDESKTTSAKNTLTWSIVGVIVIMLARMFINFVIANILGSSYIFTGK